MKFGIFSFVTDEGVRPDVLARGVEARGFDSLFVGEHSHIPADRQSPYPAGGELPPFYYRMYDPFVALTAAASATTTLLLGTGVALLTQRDPIQTAKEVASLDHYSGGRVLFGVGAGWNLEEMRDHGTDPDTRGRLLDERLNAMKELWTAEEATFHGEFTNFDRAVAWPKPVRQPHPPIYVGGNSRFAARRAGLHNGVWMPNSVGVPEAVAPMMALRDEFAPGTPVSMFAVGSKNRALLDAYVEAGVERITLLLGTHPEAKTLDRLDNLAKIVEEYR
ncbi:LLM class F420-dependent oxidoreductase [Amycolatopsis saalfeldensis]|uniref:Probable F420-dependent oxidoreductase, Rv2161c family n=1 Tax=Amycolatopsis saalfeldensis TaxID=394193 RepID=A0A1H8X4B3_9PSEU|nr:LLM class F420-dependent oxidoreductase [Amycolatopsis saalfeldensis]SEP34762.1 probable F420-dependent oxidoreductase, Rv2161c family [Amycolatopsis saalfeldensis]